MTNLPVWRSITDAFNLLFVMALVIRWSLPISFLLLTYSLKKIFKLGMEDGVFDPSKFLTFYYGISLVGPYVCTMNKVWFIFPETEFVNRCKFGIVFLRVRNLSLTDYVLPNHDLYCRAVSKWYYNRLARWCVSQV